MFFRRPVYLTWLLLLLTHSAGLCAAGPPGDSVAQHTPVDKLRLPGISNAAQVNEFLYRGAQPDDEGVRQLKKLGIDTIVDLRGESQSGSAKERRAADSAGIQFVNIAGNGWSPPRDEQVAQFFSLILQKPRQRIFVHCWFGSDRTGVFIALYRIAFEGWTPEQALEEMHAFHFKSFWHPAMEKYVRGFPARLTSSPALAPFREAGVAKNR